MESLVRLFQSFKKSTVVGLVEKYYMTSTTSIHDMVVGPFIFYSQGPQYASEHSTVLLVTQLS